LSPIFRLNQEFGDDSSGLVAGIGREWKQLLVDLKCFASLIEEIDIEKTGNRAEAA
jgi:hypothetical protein